jgi:hypothetical protein
MKVYAKLLLISLLIVVFIGCYQKKEIWYPLNESQKSEFFKNNHIKLLVTRDTQSTTIILCENSNGTANYQVSADEDGKMKIWSTGSSNFNEDTVQPVNVESIDGFNPGLPTVSYVVVIIKDQKILGKAKTIKVEFDDGKEVTETLNNSKAIIVLNNNKPIIKKEMNPLEVKTVAICDKEGTELYKR